VLPIKSRGSNVLPIKSRGSNVLPIKSRGSNVLQWQVEPSDSRRIRLDKTS